MDREPFATRTVFLRGPDQVERAIAVLRGVPLDARKPLQFLVREEVRPRKLCQQGLMWAGPLADIAEQVMVEGRMFSDKVWHEYAKAKFLPESYDPELCISEDYQKWAIGPAGNRVLVGSTTDLTVRGMSDYLEQLFAMGAQRGVRFTEPPRRG